MIIRETVNIGRDKSFTHRHRSGSLDRHHKTLSRCVVNRNLGGALVPCDPRHDLGTIRCVHDHAKPVRPPVDQHIVQNAAALVADQSISDLALLHRRGVVGENPLDQVQRVRPLEPQPAHVTDVKNPRRRSDRLMFLNDAAVLNRHVPAGEIDYASAVGHVPIIERSALGQDRLDSRSGERRCRPAGLL